MYKSTVKGTGNTETSITVNCIFTVIELLNEKFVTPHNKYS